MLIAQNIMLATSLLWSTLFYPFKPKYKITKVYFYIKAKDMPQVKIKKGYQINMIYLDATMDTKWGQRFSGGD
jgi:hypothetical protein